MPAQSAQPAGRRRGVGGMFVDVRPLRRHRDFRRLWAGQLVSQVGSQLTIVAVAYQTYRLTGSTAMVGLVSLGQLFPLLAGSLLGGPLVDAWDRRRVMLYTQVLLAVGCAGLAVNALLAHPLLWLIFGCTAESAAFQGLDWSARRASLRQLVPPAELPAALSLQSAAFQVTSVVGPAAAGLLIAQAGFALVYWVNVASFGVAFVTVAVLPRLPPRGGGQPIGLASLAGGIRYVRTSHPLAGVFLIDLGAMVFGMPRALFPALTVTLYGGGAATVGYLNAAPGVGALVGSLLTGHVGRVRRVGRAVVICVIAWGAAITGFGLVPWLPAALVLLAVAGAADVISSVFRMVIVQQATPDGMQGRVNSLIFAGIQGGPRLGDAEAGAAAALAGPQFAAWSGGLLSVLTAAATCWVLPEIWRYLSSSAEPRSVADPDVPDGRLPGPDLPGPDLPGPDLPGPDLPGPAALRAARGYLGRRGRRCRHRSRRDAVRTGIARTGTAGARAGALTGGWSGRLTCVVGRGRRTGGRPFTGHGRVSRTRQGKRNHARGGQPGQADRGGRAPHSRPAALPLGGNRQHVPLALVHQ